MNRRLTVIFPPFIALILVAFSASAQRPDAAHRADSVLKLMTLQEKIGQLNQYNDDHEATGPVTLDPDKEGQVRRGGVGSLLNCNGVDRTRRWQTVAMESHMKIPLLFGQDVVHGYKTTFPIPLAEACSWDLAAIERSARIAAIEASASGIHWTFAPMVDISRDPRWGRVMEGAGEDPCLGSLIAAARVKGFQGSHPGDTNAVLACVKHFAAYGAAIGGRDYNSVDVGERTLREVYLAPYMAAVKAGAATVMTSFNDINGVPSTGNAELLTGILRNEWGFKGFVVSDWGSVGEMINHGNVASPYEAAECAISAGCDMDMESRCYKDNLERLVREGKLSEKTIDDAVLRVLVKKFELGLFDDPYRFCNEARQQRALDDPAHAAAARDMARRSIVLLKNDNHLLPLKPGIKTIALIGPMVKQLNQNKGFWDVSVPGVDSNFIVSQYEGITARAGRDTRVLYARGCNTEGDDRSGFAEAEAVARQSDVVILSMGETREMSGEAHSRSNIGIPGVQEDLLAHLIATGKPVVVLIHAGRPLVFDYTAEHAPAILCTWWLGSEAGNAIADVLSGDYNPSAKLAMTFPRSVGQIPIYYNHYNTGRPAQNDSDRFYRSAYTDLSLYPRYEFGYGLSYTTFRYSDLKMDKKRFGYDEKAEVTLTVTNTGEYDGEETVQLYIRDLVGSVVRPVAELKDFAKVMLKKGESKRLRFVIDTAKLAFYNKEMKHVAEPGMFELMIGASSRDIRQRDRFELTGMTRSYHKLTTSNGLIVAVYDEEKRLVDYVFPHIFANFDSTHYVNPFAGNIRLITHETPTETGYEDNTHVIRVRYPDFTARYFASFTRDNTIFYVSVEGKTEIVENLTVDADTGNGSPLYGPELLVNPLQDIPVALAGHALTGSVTIPFGDGMAQKYFLFSLTDSLHGDKEVVRKEIARLRGSEVAKFKNGKETLAGEEVRYMNDVFARCTTPAAITEKERNVVEQSVSFLKMAQVSDAEVLPGARGQVLASLRPGLWHICWVRDGSYAIQAMTRLGMYDEAKKALEFMLKAKSGKYRRFVHTDGKVYGPGADYQVSLTRYFGNGEEECDWNEDGPNIEYDDFGLFLTAWSDYVQRSGDKAFFRKWNPLVKAKVADVTVQCIAADSLILADSGPWEHHLGMTRQYTFTSGVCARGLETYAQCVEDAGMPTSANNASGTPEAYRDAANRLRAGIMKHMLCEGGYFKGNSTDTSQTAHEYFDAGVYEIFANGLMKDSALFASHLAGCAPHLRLPGDRPGYIRLKSRDPYENQEWVFINLRIAQAHLLFGQRNEAALLLNHVTDQAAVNFNTIPEMYSNRWQMAKVPKDYYGWDVWCNCIRQESNRCIGTIPMIGYGCGAYVLALYASYGK